MPEAKKPRIGSFRATALVLFALALAFACSRSEGAAPPGASQKPPEIAPPANLLAELTVPDPRRLWASLRALGGSRAEVLPSSYELALFGALDLPPRVAGFVKPETPIVGVIVAPPGAAPAGVFGLRAVRGAELVAELTRGEGATLRAEHDGSPVTLLVGTRPTPVLGVVDDWLLVSGDVATLRAAGPYVARVLGARVPPEAPLALDVTRDALVGPVARVLRERWATVRSGLGADAKDARATHGRPADFGDPSAVLALGDGVVERLLEFVGSARRLRFSLRPSADHLEVALSITPESGGALARGVEALDVGSLEPLLRLPSSVVLATLSRSNEAERRTAAEQPADALRAVLGSRLAEKEAAPLADALRSYHRGRGAVAVGGIFADKSVFLRQEARDPKELERGLRGLLRSLGAPALREPLEPLVGKISPRESETRVSGLEGAVRRVELSRPTPESPGLEVLLQVRGGLASVAAAPNARPALISLSLPAETLGEQPTFKKLAEGRAPAALALYTDFSVMNPAGGRAPVLAVVGRKDAEAVLEAELSAPACAALLERLGSP